MFLSLLFGVEHAFAGGVTLPPVSLPNPLNLTGVSGVLNAVTSALYDISIPLVAILVIVGALQILFAGGKPEGIQKGKKTLLWTVVGFAIILTARGIVALITELIRR